MSDECVERRRYPRSRVGPGCEFRGSRSIRVRLLDLSEAGALVATAEPLPGGQGRLRITLGRAVVHVAIDVEREGAAPGGRGRVAGVSFEGLQPLQRAALGEFLARAGD